MWNRVRVLPKGCSESHSDGAKFSLGVREVDNHSGRCKNHSDGAKFNNAEKPQGFFDVVLLSTSSGEYVNQCCIEFHLIQSKKAMNTIKGGVWIIRVLLQLCGAT